MISVTAIYGKNRRSACWGALPSGFDRYPRFAHSLYCFYYCRMGNRNSYLWNEMGKMLAALTAVGVALSWCGVPAAAAETVDLGDSADVDIIDIEIEQHWTVSDIRPSSDVLPYRPAGSLWEATAIAELPHGGVPVVSGFSARAESQSYPVLWGVAAAQGLPPNALPPGGTTAGKLYFDVTGAPPDSVAYTIDGVDVAVWKEAD